MEDIFSLGQALAALDGRNLADEFGRVASEIQRVLAIPPIALPGLEIGLRTAPARLVGGDYLDVVLQPNAAAVFGIGEISGKSLSAALKAFGLKFVVRAALSASSEQLADVMRRVNQVMMHAIEPDEFASALICRFADGNRSLNLSNAGHDPPLIFRSGRGEVDESPAGGLVLGVARDEPYYEQRLALEAGDVVALYTDGFTEARNAAGEQFTLAQLKQGFLEHGALPAQALADALFERIERFTAGTLRDDASILLIRVTGAP